MIKDGDLNLEDLRKLTIELSESMEKAESIRKIAEEARQKAEEAREIAEDARTKAEKIRQEIFIKLKEVFGEI